jgi:formyl-CoA transferase
VPCAPVNTISQSAVEEHLAARDVMVEVPDENAGTMFVTGRVMKFSRSGMPVGSAPTVGQHTDEILSGLLGRSPDEIADLRAAGVV